MFIPKTENEIHSLHQALITKKSLDCSSMGSYIEQFIENMADTLDNIAGSGLLYNGEIITTIIGFSLRMISTVLKLYLLYTDSQLDWDTSIVYTILEVIVVTLLTALTLGLPVLAAAIIGIILASYFVIKQAIALMDNINERMEATRFERWFDTLVYRQQHELIDYEQDQDFIDQLCIREIILRRKLQRRFNALEYEQYQATLLLTQQVIPSDNVVQLITRYQDLTADYIKLKNLIHSSLVFDLVAIDNLTKHIIKNNHEINGLIAHYNRWDLDPIAQQNEAAIKTVEMTISLAMALAGLALAILGLLLTVSVIPLVSLTLYIVPMVLGISLVVLTLTWLFTDYYFNSHEEQHLILNVLEKANNNEFCTETIVQPCDPIMERNFF